MRRSATRSTRFPSACFPKRRKPKVGLFTLGNHALEFEYSAASGAAFTLGWRHQVPGDWPTPDGRAGPMLAPSALEGAAYSFASHSLEPYDHTIVCGDWFLRVHAPYAEHAFFDTTLTVGRWAADDGAKYAPGEPINIPQIVGPSTLIPAPNAGWDTVSEKVWFIKLHRCAIEAHGTPGIHADLRFTYVCYDLAFDTWGHRNDTSMNARDDSADWLKYPHDQLWINNRPVALASKPDGGMMAAACILAPAKTIFYTDGSTWDRSTVPRIIIGGFEIPTTAPPALGMTMHCVFAIDAPAEFAGIELLPTPNMTRPCVSPRLRRFADGWILSFGWYDLAGDPVYLGAAFDAAFNAIGDITVLPGPITAVFETSDLAYFGDGTDTYSWNPATGAVTMAVSGYSWPFPIAGGYAAVGNVIDGVHSPYMTADLVTGVVS